MGIVSEVLASDGKDTKVDRGSGDNVTAQHFSAPGDDSRALPGDYCALSEAGGTGRQTAVGYRDAKNASVTSPGEKRIYARSSDGATKVEVWLKNSGEALISNDLGNITLLPSGDVSINGVIIKADGSDIILPNGRSLMHHGHTQGQDSAGNTEQNTGDTIP